MSKHASPNDTFRAFQYLKLIDKYPQSKFIHNSILKPDSIIAQEELNRVAKLVEQTWLVRQPENYNGIGFPRNIFYHDKKNTLKAANVLKQAATQSEKYDVFLFYKTLKCCTTTELPYWRNSTTLRHKSIVEQIYNQQMQKYKQIQYCNIQRYKSSVKHHGLNALALGISGCALVMSTKLILNS